MDSDSAERLLRAGRLAEAEALCHAILKVRPEDPEVLHLLGLVLLRASRAEEAVETLGLAMAVHPEPPYELHASLGAALHAAGEQAEAIECFGEALALAPDRAELHLQLGNVLRDTGHLVGAQEAYERAIQLRPTFPEAHESLGHLLRRRGELEAAVAAYRRTLELRPDLLDTYDHFAASLASLGRLSEAVDSLRHAIEVQPDFAKAHANLGQMLRRQSKPDEALASFQRALELRPAPGLEVQAATLLPIVPRSREDLLTWRERWQAEVTRLSASDLVLDDPVAQGVETNFLLAYHGLDDRPLQEQAARLYLRACPNLAWTAPHCRRDAWRPPRNRKIRVGFSSVFFRRHTITKLNRGLIEHLSRDRFEVVVFLLGPEDNVTAAISQVADRVVRLGGPLASMREQIAAEALDILYYPEIGMAVEPYFLAFARLAPVQCVSWGHPDTTGIPTVDYFISSDLVEPPGAEVHYSERLVRLARLGPYYYRPVHEPPQPNRAHFGFEAGWHVYACPQTLFKLHPDFDQVLGEILRRDARAHVVLLDVLDPNCGALLRERFARQNPDVADRLNFLPLLTEAEYLELLTTADVLLDPPQFSGGSSSIDALSVGAPIVAWPGPFFRARITLGCYRQMGILDCVVDSPDAYINLALRLADDRAWREEIRQKILAHHDALIEDSAAVQEFERFFERAVEAAESGAFSGP